MYWLGYFGYHLGIWLYALVVQLAAFFNPKASLFVKGRRGLVSQIISDLAAENRERIWFHCASLGEFEQARPIIEQLKKDYPEYVIVLTFFSPSGYELRKKYALAEYVYYLPLDSFSNASKFVKAVNPKLSFFVKYEVWYHYLNVLKKAALPVYLISANFRQNHVYFKWYGSFFRKMLKQFTHIFCQNAYSHQRLLSIGYSFSTVSLDTRFDRVFQHAQQAKPIPVIERFTQGKKVLVAGSSYEMEERIIAETFSEPNNWKLIIAPHQVQPDRIASITKQFSHYTSIRFSDCTPETNMHNFQVLIIDNIGMLSSIYQYATCAFIGGGFGKTGLHNMLEAVAFGMPVMIGPNNVQKFPESLDLIAAGICKVVRSSEETQKLIEYWDTNPEEVSRVALNAKKFIADGTGATSHIFNFVRPVLQSR
jgi:3-deoxy-D-manno-octulosonic-acid transferase